MSKIRYAPRMADGQTVAYRLLDILQHIAPDGEAQKVCTDLHNSYNRGREQDEVMARALADGFLYGNWPWVIAAMNKEAKARLGEGK